MQEEPLSRLEMLVGSEAIQQLQGRHFLVCGLGGVGSWSAEALARSGTGRLTLLDFDTIKLSNLNRQLPALLSTLGRLKAEVLAERLRDAAPLCHVEARNDRLTPESIPQLLSELKPDAILDAIDDRPAKLALLEECVRRNLPVVSSMGAGNKTRPETVRVADLSETMGCPVARLLRKTLKKHGIEHGITCVFSPEEPVLLQGQPAPDGSGERRPLGSLITITALFALRAAHALLETVLHTDALPRKGMSKS